jgi:plastocyanin
LKVVAKGFAFDPTCLAAPAGKSVSIEFDNQDPSVPHNVDIYDKQGGKHLAGATDAGDFVTGVGSTTYKVEALPKGTYFYQCDLHPQQMTGTFVVG